VAQTETDGLEVLETREWVDSLDYVLSKGGPNRAVRARHHTGASQWRRPTPLMGGQHDGVVQLIYIVGCVS